MMYYKLRNHLELRSYSNKPFVILNKNTKNIFEVSQLVFEALKLCDGSNDLANLPVYEKLLKHDIIEINDEKKVPYLDYKKYDNRYFSAGWAITKNCNFRCKHCFVTNGEKKEFEEFSTQECFRVIDQLKSCGINFVTFFGGEPLVRKDFWQIVDYMLEQGIVLSAVYTNASLIDEEFLNKFKDRNMCPMFHISFDGIGYHDFVRNRVGAEKEVIEKMKLIVSKGFGIVCTMSVFKENLQSIFDTIELLSDIGVNILRVQPILPTANWLHTGCNFVTSDDIFKCGLDVLKKFCDKPLDMNIIFFSWFSATKDKIALALSEDSIPEFLTCSFWRSSIFITSEGKVVPCPMIDFDKCFDADDIRQKSLHDILISKKYLDLVDIDLKVMGNKEKCDNCTVKARCKHKTEVCLAPSFFRTGSLKLRDSHSTCDFMLKYVDDYQRLARAYNDSVACR